MSSRRRHPLAGLTQRGLRLALRGRRLPITSGRLHVRGLHARISISRDRWGVVHVGASDDHDAWFGLGFCQGQDRSFQLSMLARVANGALSEVAGPAGLGIDKMSRRLGFAARAGALLEVQDDAVREQIEAFAAGVNAGVKVGRRGRAPAFALTRSRPRHFSAHDVMAMMQLQSFGLASNWDLELARWMILRLDGEQALRDLDPGYARHHPVASEPGRGGPQRSADAQGADTTHDPAARRLVQDLHALRRCVAEAGASNVWALAGARTSSGKPLLANDPHLPPTLPSPWYLCHLTTPDWEAAGACMVGLPAIAAGHNGFGAWGVTAGMCDATDLFVHEFDAQRCATKVEGVWQACTVRNETIFVRGSAPHIERVVETPHGPLLADLVPGDNPDGPATNPATSPATHPVALSLQATWMHPRRSVGLLGLHRARCLGEARAALARWPAMPLGIAWADADGDIAYVLAAELPLRRQGWGMLPRDGREANAGWAGLVPGEQMPSSVNPPGGFVVSANQRAGPAEGGTYLGEDWLEGYRASAIERALGARDDWDLSSSMQLQMDDGSGPWDELRDVLLGALVEGDDEQMAEPSLVLAHQQLGDWDGRVSADSIAATLFELWVAQMSMRVAKARAPRAHSWALGETRNPLVPASFFALRRVGHLARLLREAPQGWFAKGWGVESRSAMQAVVARLRRSFGEDPRGWRWGEVRTLTFRHALSEAAPALGPLLDRGPFEWGGDSHTVGQASVRPMAPLANPMAVASLRCVIDTGDFSRARFCIAGGQSGNPLSPHYDGLMDLWLRGQGIPIAFGAAAVENAAVDRLDLRPAT